MLKILLLTMVLAVAAYLVINLNVPLPLIKDIPLHKPEAPRATMPPPPPPPVGNTTYSLAIKVGHQWLFINASPRLEAVVDRYQGLFVLASLKVMTNLVPIYVDAPLLIYPNATVPVKSSLLAVMRSMDNGAEVLIGAPMGGAFRFRNVTLRLVVYVDASQMYTLPEGLIYDSGGLRLIRQRYNGLVVIDLPFTASAYFRVINYTIHETGDVVSIKLAAVNVGNSPIYTTWSFNTTGHRTYLRVPISIEVNYAGQRITYDCLFMDCEGGGGVVDVHKGALGTYAYSYIPPGSVVWIKVHLPYLGKVIKASAMECLIRHFSCTLLSIEVAQPQLGKW